MQVDCPAKLIHLTTPVLACNGTSFEHFLPHAFDFRPLLLMKK
jgi:hypothetical protein